MEKAVLGSCKTEQSTYTLTRIPGDATSISKEVRNTLSTVWQGKCAQKPFPVPLKAYVILRKSQGFYDGSPAGNGNCHS